MDREESVPAGLACAAAAEGEPQAALIHLPGTGRLSVVIEPGRDPGAQWRDLLAFLGREGIARGSPDPPAARESA